jgi:hypothetical protein
MKPTQSNTPKRASKTKDINVDKAVESPKPKESKEGSKDKDLDIKSFLSEILMEVKNLKKQSEEFRTETKKSRTSKRKYSQQAKNGRRNSAL